MAESEKPARDSSLVCSVRLMDDTLLTLQVKPGTTSHEICDLVIQMDPQAVIDHTHTLFCNGKKMIQYEEKLQGATIQAVESSFEDDYLKAWINLEGFVTDTSTGYKTRARMIVTFLDQLRNDHHSLALKHLHSFESLAVMERLCQLYSENKQGLEVLIVDFIKTILEPHSLLLKAYGSHLAFLLCDCLKKTVGSDDLMYLRCRLALSGCLRIVFDLNPDHDLYKKWASFEVSLPLLSEIGSQLKEDMTMENADLPHISSLCLVLTTVADNIQRATEEQKQSVCFFMNNQLLECTNDFLCQLDFQQEGSSNCVSLLKALSWFSNLGICKDFQTRLYALLCERRSGLNAVILHSSFRSFLASMNYRWLVGYQHLLEPSSSTHVAMSLLEWKGDTGSFELRINRLHILNRSVKLVNQLDPEELQQGVFIIFKHEMAQGIGVLHEWFHSLFNIIFAVGGPFKPHDNDDTLYSINPDPNLNTPPGFFRFCGRFLALTLMHNACVGKRLDPVLFRQLAGANFEEFQIEDIQKTDLSVYNHLTSLLEINADTLDSYALMFPENETKMVTMLNRHEYVETYTNYFFRRVHIQATDLSSGFSDIVPHKEFFYFMSHDSFGQIIAGDLGDISVEDWRMNTKCIGYEEDDDIIGWFWEIVGILSQNKLRGLLYFWASIKYLPTEGFGALDPQLEIHRDMADDTTKLPESHTCANMLSFPAYKTYEDMKSRLNKALEYCEGFGFI